MHSFLTNRLSKSVILFSLSEPFLFLSTNNKTVPLLLQMVRSCFLVMSSPSRFLYFFIVVVLVEHNIPHVEEYKYFSFLRINVCVLFGTMKKREKRGEAIGETKPSISTIPNNTPKRKKSWCSALSL